MDATSQNVGQPERFDVVRKLGAGAMGVVFHVRDRHNAGQDVALKILERFDAAALYRFKHEFRTLADVVHPNLVSLYELLTVGERWMFTMELIDGVPLLDYIRAAEPEVASDISTRTAQSQTEDTTATAQARPGERHRPKPIRPATADELERLRAALPQMVEGVSAIHERGKLHRDLKPSNVMVDAGGRVVILDFGVATGLVAGDQTVSRGVVGTPLYMAPEQARHQPLGPASDWYAVGVMVYEALCGRRPFEGGTHSVMAAKVSQEAPPIDALVPGAPGDLCELCMALLATDPSARPGADAIRDLLGVTRPRGSALPTAAAGKRLLVGRERELDMLGAALAAAQTGAGSVVHVRGRSGMGKTALVEAFLDTVGDRDDAVVLRGRCYEQESVPYKALDSLIDSLALHLSGLPDHELEALMPSDISALVRLFPVLRRIDALVAAGIGGLGGGDDPVALRLRAFSALRGLVERLCDRVTPVLYIDDLQWGDTESAELLADVFPPDDMPAALVILSYRPEEQTSPFLRAFGPPAGDAQRISIGRLPLASARKLATALLTGMVARLGDLAEPIARESGGSPFFVEELARYVLAVDDPDRVLDESWHISLEDVLAERIDELSAEEKRVLELIAIAAHPIPQATALTAAGLTPRDVSLMVHLRGEHLVRTGGVGASATVETAHDRIRETVVDRLDADQRRDYHGRIAHQLEARGDADPEMIAVHLEAAGESDRVVEYLLAAAAKAVDGLAFERAAGLLTRALGLTADDAPERQDLLVRLGEALGYAGRSAEAADAYVAAAAAPGERSSHDLRKQAAEHLLFSGQLDRGVALLDEVLAGVGIRRPRSSRSVLAHLAVSRARLALRGSTFPVKDRTVSEDERQRLEVLWSAGIGFSMVDTFRSVEFSARHLLTALATGDAFHIARGLTAEACLVSLSGGRALRRARKLSARAIEIAEDLGRPDALQWAHSSVAFVDYQAGQWQSARRTVRRGIDLFTEHRTGFAWELSSMRTYELWSLFYLGELSEMAAKLSAFLREARERGDLHSVTTLITGPQNIVWLARGQPDALRAAVGNAMANWSHQSVHLQHFWECMSLCLVDLYEGDPASALTRLQANWKRFKRAMFLRIQMVRLELLWLRASANLRLGVGLEGRAHLRAAARDVRAMSRSEIIGYRHVGRAFSASIAAAEGDEDRARELLARAIAGFDEQGMAMHAACARQRLAELRGDELPAKAAAWFEHHQVVDPPRFSQLLIPSAG